MGEVTKPLPRELVRALEKYIRVTNTVGPKRLGAGIPPGWLPGIRGLTRC